jgi:hypothetical protein
VDIVNQISGWLPLLGMHHCLVFLADVTENDGLYMFIPSADQTTFQHGLLENP